MAVDTLVDKKRDYYQSQLGYTDLVMARKSLADLEKEFFDNPPAGGGGGGADAKTIHPTGSTPPAASTANEGYLFYDDDLNGGTLLRGNASSWPAVAPGRTEAPPNHASRHAPSGADSWEAFVRKPADEIMDSDIQGANSIVLQDDDHLFVPVLLNELWTVRLVLMVSGDATTGTGDIKVGVTAPAGSTGKATILGLATSEDLANDAFVRMSVRTLTETIGIGTVGTVTLVPIYIDAVVLAGANGNIRLQWCQNTTSTVPTTVHADSFLEARRKS